MADMTLADMMALTNKNHECWRNGVTRADLADGFNTSKIQNGIVDLAKGQNLINNNVLGNRYDSAVGMAGLDKGIMQSRYDTLLGQNALGMQIAQNRYDAAIAAQNMQAQMSQCCCDLKTAVHAEGEATRAAIQQQTIDDLKSQLNQAQTAVANAVQSQNLNASIQGAAQNILNNLGRYYQNPPVNPYAVYGNGFYGNGFSNGYGGCGCGC